jgi:hypothetical protein
MISMERIFGGKPDPRAARLDEGDQKYKKTKELIFPPTDENGRYLDDRPKMKDKQE